MTEVKEAPINYPGRLRHSVEEARGFCKTCSCAARLEDWPSDNEDGRGKSGKALQIQPGGPALISPLAGPRVAERVATAED